MTNTKWIAFIPAVLDDLGLYPSDFRVYAHIMRRAGGPNGYCDEGNKGIASTCRMKVNTVSESISRLEEYGLLFVENRPGRANKIRPVDSSSWIDSVPKIDRTRNPNPIQLGVISVDPIEGGGSIQLGVLPPDPIEGVTGRSNQGIGVDPIGEFRSIQSGHTKVLHEGTPLKVLHSKGEKSPKSKYQDFVDCYNDHKPKTWTGVREINEAREKLIQKWTKTHGRREALDRLKAALLWVNRPNMSFWIQKPGQHGLISLGRSDRLFEWSEAWYEYESGNAILGASEADASAAITHAENVVHYGAWVQEMEARHGA